MKASNFFISTSKKIPVGTEIISYTLMLRAGMIQRIASGIYNYLPVGLRSIQKIERLIRSEMKNIGAVEVLMANVQPSELWQESRRLKKYGLELLRLKDRHKRNFVLGPTHEEVITDIVRKQIKSYKQLPIIFFQIQTKFRDEIRPRFGVMRSREFIMKDAYSFDKDLTSLQSSYQSMFHLYECILKRIGLNFRVVCADNGSVGGYKSHEFHVITKTGEDTIAYCPQSNYAANIEVAEVRIPLQPRAVPSTPLKQISIVFNSSKDKDQIQIIAHCLNINIQNILKPIILITETEKGKIQVILLLLRGDHDINEIKLSKLHGLTNYRFAIKKEIINHFGCSPVYVGPIGIQCPTRIIIDYAVSKMSDFACGSNREGYYFTGVNWQRDLPEEEIADLRNITEGDLSPDGMGLISLCKGIEVAHIFQLGTCYSKLMSANYVDNLGKDNPIYMGCYGIGITRILGAIIEQNYDDYGIIFPELIAPFEIVICPLEWQHSEIVKEHAVNLYNKLQTADIDVILDDRGERPGVMLTDWELIGIPHRIIISNRSLSKQNIEYQNRRNRKTIFMNIQSAAELIIAKIKKKIKFQ